MGGEKKKTKKELASSKKVNPFELKFNRSKHEILGKKKLATVGAPTVSRKRAHDQRHETLGVEYSRVGKVSKIIDRRIGEKDNKTEEEKTALRFTEERVKNYKKANKFNLADDADDYEDEDILTHSGRALSDIEKYDKSMLSDDDDGDDSGAISADMVKIAHFGGGTQTTEEKVNAKLNRKDAIAEMIAKTKVARQEKQAARDDMEMLTESLDEKYHSLLSRINSSFRPVGATKNEKLEKDDYDSLALSLKMDSDIRATPAEKTKTEEEQAASERERLERLERQRIARMNTAKNSYNHLSVDADVDIDAGLKYDLKKLNRKEARFAVTFDNKGDMIDSDKVEKFSIKKVLIDSDDEEEISVDDEESDKDLDDLLAAEDVDDSGEREADETEEGAEKATKTAVGGDDNTIPFVFAMPRNYELFRRLLAKFPSENLGIVLERLVKCHHPSLKEGNKKLLNRLFLMIMRMFNSVAEATPAKDVLQVLNVLQNSLYVIMKFDLIFAAQCSRAVIRVYWKKLKENLKKSTVPFNVAMMFRLVAVLYPVSDNWHPVSTPALYLATHAVTNARITDVRCLARQLYLASSMADSLANSKRYVPELMSFVQSALLLAVKVKPHAFACFGFPVSEPHCNMLCIEKPVVKVLPLSLYTVFSNDEIDEVTEDELRVSVLRSLIALVQLLRVVHSTHNESLTILFAPILKLLRLINTEFLPLEVKEELETLITSTDAECRAKSRITQLSLVKTEKSMLKMLEPRFEFDFDPERPRKGRDTTRKGAKGERKKLEQQVKKEKRGAIKELRKDTAFLARKQIASVKAKDRERNVKTKRLISGLQQQQGEWNKELRESGKKKK